VLPEDRTPHALLERVRQYLSGVITAEALEHRGGRLRNHVVNLDYQQYRRDKQCRWEFAVADAATAVAAVALVDERFEPGEIDPSASDSDLEVEEWDAAFHASVVSARGAPWNRESSAERRFTFWTWYLTEAVPQVWAVDFPNASWLALLTGGRF
jgi:hypothetical protein